MENLGKIYIKPGRKFLNLPLSGKILKKGDQYGDYFFVGYAKGKTVTKEKWCNQESWWHLNVREAMRAAKNRADKHNLMFDIDVDYLKSIFPEDGLCPVFGGEMTFCNTDKWSSASLDRIDIDKGYVKGNVQWISMKANTLKGNAHPYDLLRLANFLVKQFKETHENK